MYTKEQLQDAVICATRSIAKLYDSREELEEAVNKLADDEVRRIVLAAAVAAIECQKLINRFKSVTEN